MEEKILKEIKEIRKLMDLPLKEILVKSSANLLTEGYRFNFDIPDFPKFKAKANSFNLVLPDENVFKGLNKLDIGIPSNAIKHLEGFRAGWLTKLMDEAGLSIDQANAAIEGVTSILKKIESGKKPNLSKISSKNDLPAWANIPKEGDLRAMVLYNFKKKFPEDYKLLETDAAVLKSNGAKIESPSTKLKVVKDTSDNKVKPNKSPKNTADAKKLGYDELKMLDEYRKTKPTGGLTDMYKDISSGKWSPSSKTKIKSKSKTPTTKLSASGFKPGDVGYKIETTKKPDGSGYYEFSVVRDEWRGDGGGNNDALGKAWKENWRPGDEIPEKYSASYKAETKTKSEEILNNTISDEKSGIKQLINAENRRLDPTSRKAEYTIEAIMDDFGLDENPTPEQIELLTKAWRDFNYRGKYGSPNFFKDYPQFIVKDTKKAIERLVANTQDVDNLNNKWRFDDVTQRFGLSDPPTRQDLELFYNAWDEGKWRPKTKDGRVNPVPDVYQTERYKRRISLEKGEIFKDLPKDYTNKANPNILTSFIRWIGRTFLYRQVGFWEDVTRTAIKTEQGYLQGKIDALLKDALNKIRAGKDIDMFYLRAQILKAGANGDVANNFKLFMLDKYYKKAILDDIDNLIDDPELKDAVKIQVDTLFERIKGKSIEEFTRDNTEWASWFRSAGDDNEPSLNVIEAIRDTYTSKSSYRSKIFAVLWRDYISGPSGKKILITVSQRVINLVKSGTIWTKAELLAMRSVDNFSAGGAWKDLFIRKVITKVLLPTLYATIVWGYNSTQINREEVQNKDFGEFSQDNWFKQVMKEVSDEFLIGRVYKEIWGDDKTNPYWKLAESLGNLTSSEIDDMIVYFGKTSKTIDVVKGDYRIRYLVPEKKLLWGSIEWNTDYWKYFPGKDRYGTYNEVQLKIEELISSRGATYICDVSSEKSKKLKEKLEIPENKKTFCQIKFFCNLTTGGCQELNDPNYTGNTYNSLEECSSKSNCEANKKAFDAQQKDAEQKSEIEKLRKEREPKKEDEKIPEKYIISDNGGKSERIPNPNYCAYLYKKTKGDGLPNRFEEQKFYKKIKKPDGTLFLLDHDQKIHAFSINEATGNGLYTDKIEYTKFIDTWNTEGESKSLEYANNVQWEPLTLQKNESIMKTIRKYVMLEQRMKFGLDNFKHWNQTFKFQSEDEKNPGQFKDVKINMEDVMDRIDHFRKKYDEDDAFVRAVIDTHENVIRFMFTKDLADIHETARPVGLAYVLSVIKEGRGEMEIWTVSRPASGNWFLVKGDFNKNQLANMELKKVEPKDKEKKKKEKPEEGLKKKEEEALVLLKNNEKKGLNLLPKKVREKVKEKLRKGWVVDEPFEFFKDFYNESEINTVFNEKLKIYKLNPTKEFFDSLVQNSPQIFLKRSFCKSLENVKSDSSIDDKSKQVMKHLLSRCDSKFKENYGINQI